MKSIIIFLSLLFHFSAICQDNQFSNFYSVLGGFKSVGFAQLENTNLVFLGIGGDNFYHLTCTDSLGNTVWSKKFQFPVSTFGIRDITATKDGAFLVTGNFGINPTNFKFHVMKISDNGTLLWSKEFTNDYYPVNKSTTFSVALSDSSSLSVSNVHNWDGIQIVKLNANGNVVWDKVFFSGNQFFLTSGVEMLDGTLVFSGFNNHQTISGFTTYGTLVSLSHTGQILWAKEYKSHYLEDLTYFQSEIRVIGRHYPSGNFHFLKFDGLGNNYSSLQAIPTGITSISGFRFSSINRMEDNSYLLYLNTHYNSNCSAISMNEVGEFHNLFSLTSPETASILPIRSDELYYLHSVNQNENQLNLIRAKKGESTCLPDTSLIIFDSTSNLPHVDTLIITDSANTYDSLWVVQLYDDTLFSYSSCTAQLDVTEIAKVKNEITIFPNPSSGNFTIQNPFEGETILEILNYSGQIVDRKILYLPSENIQMNLSISGIYILQLTSISGENQRVKISVE